MQRIVTVLVALAVALGATSLAHAQPARTITGTVIDQASGTGVVGATVQVKDTPGMTAPTGADGTFTLAKGSTAEVVLQVSAPDYEPVEVKLKAAKTSTTIAIYIVKKPPVIPATRTLTGLVRDGATNAPIVGAIVKVQGTALQADTDADGLFVIPGAPSADVVLEVTAADHNPLVSTVSATAPSARIALAPTVVAPLPPVAPVAPTTRSVHGKITETGSSDPIPGATVAVVGSTNVGITDEKGEFVLDGLPLGQVKLTIESAGYKSVDITVLATVATVSATLELASNEQVFIEGRAPVIVKTNLANGASVIKADDLNRVSSPTLDTAMQGKISGANLQYNSGAPGGGAQLRLRGISTINGQSSPLYVVDGVIISNVSIPSGANALTAAAAGGSTSNQDNAVNRVSDLNPNDIETVEVLKGAAAAALYGSKAANGVVIITTKHGHGGKATVGATQRVGFSQVSNQLGSRKFNSLAEVMEAFPMNQAAADAYNAGKTYNHESELTQTSLASETVVSATGGTATGGYFGSVLLHHEPGVVIGTGYDKQSGRLGATWEWGKRLKLAVTANIIHSAADRGLTNNDNTGVSTYVVLASTPSFFNLNKNAQGLYPVNPFVGSGANPLQTQALLTNNEDVWRFIGAANASLKLWETAHQSLTLQSNFGVDRFHQVNTLFSPPELNYEGADGLPGTSIYGSTSNINLNTGTSLVYTYEPDNQKWKSATSVGYTFEYVNLASTIVVAQDLTAGQQNVASGTSIALQQQRLKTKDQGTYLQEEIQALDKRLSVLGAVLAERSSLNGDTDQFYLYPKFAATYEIPQKALDTMRVRAAIGQAGNRPNYGTKFTPLNATTNIGGAAGIVITGLNGAIAGDPDIKPERQTEFEIGIDLATKNQRGVLELTTYQRNITDLLLQRTVAPSTGFSGEFFNGGELQNRGVEAAIQVIPVQNPFEWISRATFTLNRSTIKSLPVPTFDISTVGFGSGLGAFRIEEGKSATQIVGTTGAADGKVSVIGNGEPDFRVGWANNFKYKNYGLTTLLDWQQGSNIVNLTRLLYDFGQVSKDYTTKGTGRLDSFSAGDIRPYIEDATFVKLREVSLYWQVPDKWVKQAMLETLRVSLQGRNLLTLTNYSGLDPEVSNFGNQPIGRNYDVAPYPPSRSYWLSVDATF